MVDESIAQALQVAQEYPVLYVDDEPDNLEVFEAQFEDEFCVLCASSGKDALALMERRAVSILVTDQRMPVMPGVELCELVSRRFPHVLRILVTAYSSHETVIEAINRGGVMRYLTKPWDALEVRQVLRDSVTRAHLEAMVRRLRSAILQGDRQASAATARARLIHDLANPLQVVSNSSDMLQELMGPMGQHLPPELFAQVDEVASAMEHAARQTSNLFARSRSRTQEIMGLPGHSRVAEIIDSARHLIQASSPGGPRLLVPSCGELTAWCNAAEVGRILVNLITNAFQAMDAAGQPGGRVMVKAGLDREMVVLEVSDDGPGVPPDLAAHIFEPCVSSRTEDGGSGLGLAICKELARANHGRIELLRRRDEGATFRLWLPKDRP